MRNDNRTTKSGRGARYRVIALALGICALVIPATASAKPIAGYASLDDDSTQIPHGALYSSFDSSSPAPIGEPTVISTEPGDPGGGVDWVSAAIGAGAAMGLLGLGGAGLLALRRRTAVSPSASTSSGPSASRTG